MNWPDPSTVDRQGVAAATTDGVGLIEGERFVDADDRLADLYGYDEAGDIVDTEWRSICEPKERNRIEREAFSRSRTDLTWRDTAVGRRADGSTFLHELSVRRIGDRHVIWAVREVGSESEGEPAPSGSEHQYRRLFDAAPVPIGVFTATDGIVYCNEAAVDFFGAEDREEVLGQSPGEFVHPDDRERVGRRIEQVVEEREPTEPLEERLIGLDGEERIAVVASVPVTYHGEPAAQVIMNDVTEYKRTQTELEEKRLFLQSVMDAVDDFIYVLVGDGEVYDWNDGAAETLGYSHEEIAELHPTDVIPEDQHNHIPGVMEAIDDFEDTRVEIDLITKEGERLTHEFKGTTFEHPETGRQFRCGVARDITERLERERALERQRDDLATLDRINEVLLETTREVIETGSRESVERTVCERLASTDLYQFAWVGEREYDGDRIVPRVTAGDDGGYLDEVTITADGRETGLGPVGRAMRTGEVQVAMVDDPAFGPWRGAAAKRGFESVAAIPLHHDGSVYGVLVLYATNDDAFSLREQAGFDVLGQAVGSVIYAARNRELLFADAVVELEFGVEYPESELLGAATDLDSELALDGYVSSGEQWILYLTVNGVSPDDAIEAFGDAPRVNRARVVNEEDGGGRLELIVDELLLLDTVAAAGATVRTATADPTDARVTVEAPVDAEIREVVDHIQTEYPNWSLLAHRERDREVSTGGRPGDLLDELTDRQREALEAGFRAGYFAWPRESTAEEVAASLDLAPPTLHGHLRKAEQTILSRLLDET